jgi:hypothetical protein
VHMQDLALVIVLAVGNDYLPSSLPCKISKSITSYFSLRSLPRWQERSLLTHSAHGQMLAFDAEFLLHYLMRVFHKFSQHMLSGTTGSLDPHSTALDRGPKCDTEGLEAEALVIDSATESRDTARAAPLSGTADSNMTNDSSDSLAGEREGLRVCADTSATLMEPEKVQGQNGGGSDSAKFGFAARKDKGNVLLQLPRSYRSLLHGIDMSLLPECLSLEELAKTMTDPRLLALLDWADGHNMDRSSRLAVLAAALGRHQV